MSITFNNELSIFGLEKIHMGNGSGIEIFNIGTCYIKSNITDQNLILKNLLHTPSITKNLLIVSQFVWENKVFFEFYLDTCPFKSQGTKTIILQEGLMNGLYEFQHVKLVNPSMCFSTKFLVIGL